MHLLVLGEETNIGLDFASRLASFYLVYVHACNCLVTFHTVFTPIKETAIVPIQSPEELHPPLPLPQDPPVRNCQKSHWYTSIQKIRRKKEKKWTMLSYPP